MRTFKTTLLAAALPLGLAMTLAACSEGEAPPQEVDAVDESGGELILTDPSAEGVDVDLPQTEMTNVPDGPSLDDPAVDPATGPLPEETAAAE